MTDGDDKGFGIGLFFEMGMDGFKNSTLDGTR
jgi:hypothetical protein